MALSRDEQAALATIEAALREQDPTLAHTLTTFTRPRRRWLWATLISLLILVPMVLTLAFKLHSRMLIFVGAALHSLVRHHCCARRGLR